jgi:hypothetical protein
MSGGHGVDTHGGNKGVALLIAILALVLAFSETLGKGAQTAALAMNIEASNLWAFFQAKKRDRSMAAYHHYELASAAVQIAIVLASASIITSMAVLVWIAGALGALGVAFCVIGFFIPAAVHLF